MRLIFAGWIWFFCGGVWLIGSLFPTRSSPQAIEAELGLLMIGIAMLNTKKP